MAEFRIDQVTPGAGTPNRARHDLVADEVITLTATTPAPGAGVSYLWEILDKVGSIATLSATTGTTVTVQPSGEINRPCAFKVRLTANDNGTITVVERVFSVPTAKLGLRIPLFAETAPAEATLTTNTPDDSVDNAVYSNRAGLGSNDQNWRGWAEWAYQLTISLEVIDHNQLVNYLVGEHRIINDAGTSSTELWSASRINALIEALTSGYARREAVINIAVSTSVPPTEVNGDRYILDFSGAPHANWDGAAQGDIVEFNGTTWDATSPAEGWIAYLDAQNNDALYVDDGSPTWEIRIAVHPNPHVLGDGSVSAPTYSYGTQTDTGEYLNNSTDPTLGLAVEGADALLIRRLLDRATTVEAAFTLIPTINKGESDLAWTGLKLNATITNDDSSEVNKLFDFQVSSVSAVGAQYVSGTGTATLQFADALAVRTDIATLDLDSLSFGAEDDTYPFYIQGVTATAGAGRPLWVRGANGKAAAGVSADAGGDIELRAGYGGANTTDTGGIGGQFIVAAGDGGSVTGIGTGGGAGTAIFRGGRGGGATSAGTGTPTAGGDVHLRGGTGGGATPETPIFADGGDAYVDAGEGGSLNGEVLIGTLFADAIEIGNASSTTTIVGFLSTPTIALIGGANFATITERASDAGTPGANELVIYTKESALTGFSNLYTRDETGAITELTNRAPETTITSDSGTSISMTDADNGKVIRCTAATTVTVTVGTGLTPRVTVEYLQQGAGQVQVVGSGVTLRLGAAFNPYTAQQWSSVVVTVLDTDEALVRGDLAPV